MSVQQPKLTEIAARRLVAIRLDASTMAALDAWRMTHPYPQPTRAEAGRHAIREWLCSNPAPVFHRTKSDLAASSVVASG